MERFARHYMESGVAAQAYLKAGYKPSKRNTLDAAASRLARSVKVKARIRELMGHTVARNRITVDNLVEELETDRKQARDLKQPATAVSATMAIAKLTGLIVEKSERGSPGDFAQATEAQMLERVRAELGEGVAATIAKALEDSAEPVVTPAEAAQGDVDPPPIEPTNEGSSSLN